MNPWRSARTRCMTRVRVRIFAALLAQSLAASQACNGKLPSAVDDAGLRASALPAGASCAPMQTEQATLSASDAGAADSCDAMSTDAGIASPFSAARPLGVGYPDADTTLPEHVAYLTFDDGPSDWTNDVLDILRKRSVHATFFITAQQLKGPAGLSGSYVDEYGHKQVYQQLVKRELDEGHAIGNHTVDHPDLGVIHDQQVESELDENEWLINTALVHVGAKPQVLSLFRPPFGSPWYSGPSETQAATSTQPSVAQRIAHHGLNIMWNIDSTDSREWAQGESYSRTMRQEPSADAPTFTDKTARITQTVLTDAAVSAGTGIVVLMHDTHPTTRDALPAILDGLIAAGYTFETIEQYAQWRWQRPSIELTPGPHLYSQCLPERDWGCSSVAASATDAAGQPLQVCGRMWSAYQILGGSEVLGLPLVAGTRSTNTGTVSQRFEHGTIELHPENPPPCNIVVLR
jgi:peptidoglycan/xylan/chitin deacetylase (PgdA/CDA1 family)